MNWLIGKTGYSFFDVWSIVHLAFWIFAGSTLWALHMNKFKTYAISLALAYAWEIFERFAEKKWPNIWLSPESWWNSYLSDPLMCVLGVWFMLYALDNWR